MISNPIEYLKELIKTGDYRKFYRTKAWRMLSVLRFLSADHFEYQALQGKEVIYTKADTLHHMTVPVDKHLELALSKYYMNVQRQGSKEN